VNNPVKYNDPSGHDVGCGGYDASRCSSYNKLSDQTVAVIHYDIPPVVQYIYSEISQNSKSDIVSRLRTENEVASISDVNAGTAVFGAFLGWAYMVGPGQEWDHKPDIRAMEEKAKRDPDYQEAGSRKYQVDTWSNIHYGFVGKSAGFSDDDLLDGAGLAQAILDTSKQKRLKPDSNITGFRAYDQSQDRATIQIGIDLYKNRRYDLLPGDIIWSIEQSQELEAK
jgi:hypothetical protein